MIWVKRIDDQEPVKFTSLAYDSYSPKWSWNGKEITFLSLTNKVYNNPKNVISAGVNAISQINTIKKFQELTNLERSIFLIPKNNYKIEIENAIHKSKIKLKDIFEYDTDPTLLTSQIENLTRYQQRKKKFIR